MALNANRAAQNLVQIFRQRFGIRIEEVELIEAVYDALIQEIRANLEAEGVESPGEGYSVTVPTETGSVERPVDGVSVTGRIPRGRFR